MQAYQRAAHPASNPDPYPSNRAAAGARPGRYGPADRGCTGRAAPVRAGSRAGRVCGCCRRGPGGAGVDLADDGGEGGVGELDVDDHEPLPAARGGVLGGAEREGGGGGDGEGAGAPAVPVAVDGGDLDVVGVTGDRLGGDAEARAASACCSNSSANEIVSPVISAPFCPAARFPRRHGFWGASPCRLAVAQRVQARCGQAPVATTSAPSA
jgi:hypothetical protein